MPRVPGHGAGPFLRHHYGDQDGSVDGSGATSAASKDIGDLHAMSDAGMKAMFAKQGKSIATSPAPKAGPRANFPAVMASNPKHTPKSIAPKIKVPVAPAVKAPHAPAAKPHVPHVPHAKHEGGERGVAGRIISAVGRSASLVKEAAGKTAEAAVAGSGSEKAIGSFTKSLKGGH